MWYKDNVKYNILTNLVSCHKGTSPFSGYSHTAVIEKSIGLRSSGVKISTLSLNKRY